MADSSKQGGRGRGRARAGEQTGQAAPPGVLPSTVATGEVGRRGATGRRAETSQVTTTPPDGKPQRGSPEDTGSPSEVEKMAQLELISLASRPGYGSLGRKYRMHANHFELHFQTKLLTINHYHVEITHESPKVKLLRDDNRPILWKCLMDNLAELGIPNREAIYQIAYDGVSNCYTLHPFRLPAENMRRFDLEVLISKFDRTCKVHVLIQAVGLQLVDPKQVHSPDKKLMTPVQILDVMLRQFRSNPMLDMHRAFYPFRNSIFMVPVTPAPDLGGGREVWKGLFTSVHIGEDFRPLVNMDVDHTAFYKCGTQNGNGNGNGGNGPRYSVIQFLCDVFNEAERSPIYFPNQISGETALTDAQIRMFEREIKGLKVCIDYQKPNTTNANREYKVVGLDKPSIEKMFKNKEGVEKSVAAYFAEAYGQLRCPCMPTLKVGSKQKPIHLPMEHCFLSKNQKVSKKLTDNQTAAMIKQTCMAPAIRKTAIEQMVGFARFNDDPFLRNFGVSINTNMLQVDGRVLPPPTMSYFQGAPAQLRDGVWRASGMRFVLSAGCRGIAALAFGQAPREAANFINLLLNMCQSAGMQMPQGNNILYHQESDTSPQRVEKAFRTIQEKMQSAKMELGLVIVFLPVKGSPLYADVKRVAEVQLGIMTQCVVNKTVAKPTPDTLLNIAFKINMKLGGINCNLAVRDATAKLLLSKPTLVLGIDVTHPGPTDRRSPSVASVVGSMDLTHMRYAASIKVQKQRRESLVYLSDPVTDRLMFFYKTTQTKPERIIVYRDGVSEGEFKTVLREELRNIREACLKVDQGFKPKITFIVVQKRHHTRLFPADQNDACGKAKNVMPGSVVDRSILFHEDFSFYLCSHAGIQGTSRPTRYHVLHDDSKFTADELQLLSYYLCHCFSRCTRAVSIPAPVYYAHLACTRARAHLQNVIGDAMSDTASSRSGEGQQSSIPEEELIKAATVQELMRKEMQFFYKLQASLFVTKASKTETVERGVTPQILQPHLPSMENKATMQNEIFEATDDHRVTVEDVDGQIFSSSTPVNRSLHVDGNDGYDGLWEDIQRLQQLKLSDTDEKPTEMPAADVELHDDSRTSNESFLTAASVTSVGEDFSTSFSLDNEISLDRHLPVDSMSAVSRNKTFTRKSLGMPTENSDDAEFCFSRVNVGDDCRQDSNENSAVASGDDSTEISTPRAKISTSSPLKNVEQKDDAEAPNFNVSSSPAQKNQLHSSVGKTSPKTSDASPKDAVKSETGTPKHFSVQQTAVVAPMVNKSSAPLTNKQFVSPLQNSQPFVLDPEALEYLQAASSSTLNMPESDIYRQSLYVKFDPLLAQNDQITQILNPSDLQTNGTGQRQNRQIIKSVGSTVDARGSVVSTDSPPRLDNLVDLKTPSPRTIRPGPTTEKSASPVCPSTVLMKKKATPQQTVSVNDADAAFSSSPTPSPTPQVQSFVDESLFPFECDFLDSLNESQNGDPRIRKIKLQCQTYILSKEKEWLAKFKEERERSDKLAAISSKERKDIKLAIKQYEKTIEELLGKIENYKKEHKRFTDHQHVVNEKDQAIDDLRTVENALSELHRRYEHLRSNVEEYKKNEGKWHENIAETQNKLSTSEEMFHKLKEQAEEKLNAANIEINRLRHANESDTLALKALCKKQESQLASVEKSLEQKQTECSQLSILCDELITKLDRKK